MANRVTLSSEHSGLGEIADYHRDADSSLRLYFSSASPNFAVRFDEYSKAEVREELRERIKETELRSSLAVLASLEAAFRIDYLRRSQKRRKGALSRAFREIYRKKGERASLEEDIFGTWLRNSDVPRWVIGRLRGAFRFRHWLAHGRYWEPNQQYDFNSVFMLAETVSQDLQLYEVES